MSRRQTVLQQEDKKKEKSCLDRGRQTVRHIDNRTEQHRTEQLSKQIMLNSTWRQTSDTTFDNC